MKMTVSVDPGLGGTGWALWHDKTVKSVGVLHPGTDNESWDDAARILAVKLETRIMAQMDEMPYVTLYVEFPMLMESIAGIAANRSGGMLKLAYLVGCLTMRPIWADVHLVTPLQWKGQLPKAVVQERIVRQLGEPQCQRLAIKSHAWDAVGLGLYGLGVWS